MNLRIRYALAAAVLRASTLMLNLESVLSPSHDQQCRAERH